MAVEVAGGSPGQTIRERGSARRKVVLLALFVLLAGTFILAAGTGAVAVRPSEVVAIVLHRIPAGQDIGAAFGLPSPRAVNESIIWQIRLPRVVLAAVTGSALALAGTTFQALFMNPMADPYMLGVSSGAALGAVVAMFLSINLNLFGLGAVPVLAFGGAGGTMFLVYNLARVGHRVPVVTLLLSGLAVGAFFSAIVSLLVYFSEQKLHQVIFWLMGGFGGATWAQVRLSVPYAAAGLLTVMYYARDLNALSLGEESAGHLGVEVEKAKRILVGAASLLTATAVSTSGLIGFVGLMVPHLMRFVVGPDHRYLVPAAVLAGAIMTTAADTVARLVVAPAEIPVGIVTALAGGPFFLYLLKRRQKAF